MLFNRYLLNGLFVPIPKHTINYLMYILGSTGSESFKISKCKCGSSAISKTAVLPTVPSDCPFYTFSPSTTNSEVNRFEYTV